ncbi:hypothetical protein CVT25_009979 [Psilocybe cyanescens]|uniref:Uncharacterized protein n=1 Tax=Psilocybe cyanescens TaxID=93625 RepID=A0A409XCM4_PSICY|nr:hypothetical protein CVT25_009979 [Psilocybe cyanescens]
MLGLGLSMGASSPTTTKKSASDLTFAGLTHHVRMAPPASTFVPSVARNLITPSPTHVVQGTDDFLSIAKPPLLFYPDFTSVIALRPSFSPFIHVLPEVFSRVITPYSSSAFHALLSKFNLTSAYPSLVHNLDHGFPLGPMPTLKSTHIMNNHPSCRDYPDEVAQYLHDEVTACRMSGPYSRETVERILRGPFQSSPLIVAVQPQGPGVPDKVRVCR